MTQYASRYPQRQDPTPWVTEDGTRQATSAVPYRLGAKPHAECSPRPELHHVMSNPTSGLLVAIREHGNSTAKSPLDWLRDLNENAEWWRTVWPEPMIDHARLVLFRMIEQRGLALVREYAVETHELTEKWTTQAEVREGAIGEIADLL